MSREASPQTRATYCVLDIRDWILVVSEQYLKALERIKPSKT